MIIGQVLLNYMLNYKWQALSPAWPDSSSDSRVTFGRLVFLPGLQLRCLENEGIVSDDTPD